LNDVIISMYATDIDAAPPPRIAATTTTAATLPVTAKSVIIIYNGHVVRFHDEEQIAPESVMTGGHNGFFAAIEPAALVSGGMTWTASGDAIAYYSPGPSSGEVTPLDESNTHNAGFNCYWVSGSWEGTEQTVTFGATGSGVTTTRRMKFKVRKPDSSMTIDAAPPDQISAGADPFHRFDQALRYGHPADNGIPEREGVYCSGTVTTPPGGQGEIGFLQLVKSDTHGVTDAGVAMKIADSGQWVLDYLGQDPMVPGHKQIAANAQGTVDYADSPGTDIAGMKSIAQFFWARTYLMYRPEGGIWVPLRMVTWDWNGDAQKNPAQAWQFIIRGAGHGLPAEQAEEPTWEHQKDLRWIPE